jgi:hypothetical protein
VLVEVLDWLSGAIREFGLAQFDTKKVVGWCTEDLTSREAAVRTAAVGVMASVHCQVLLSHRTPSHHCHHTHSCDRRFLQW